MTNRTESKRASRVRTPERHHHRDECMSECMRFVQLLRPCYCYVNCGSLVQETAFLYPFLFTLPSRCHIHRPDIKIRLGSEHVVLMASWGVTDADESEDDRMTSEPAGILQPKTPEGG